MLSIAIMISSAAALVLGALARNAVNADPEMREILGRHRLVD